MSRPLPITARTLAEASGFDVEDVIIELARLGLSYASDPRVTIRAVDQRAALRAVGLRPKSDERKRSYWLDELSIEDPELDALLQSFGFRPSQSSRVIPKGSHAKLIAYAGARTGPVQTLPASPSDLQTPAADRPVAARAVWRQVGQRRASNFLESAEVRWIHEELAADAELASDPIFPPGVKNQHLLESACIRPLTGGRNDAKYPTVEMAAAALVHSLVNNHPFHNGNKRTALVSMLVFLDRNNQWLKESVTRAELYLWILEVARHRLLSSDFRYDDLADHEVLSMADWIRKNSRPIERSERPITWRELRSLLVHDFQCEVDSRSTSGKVSISRTVRVPSRNPLKGFRRTEVRTFVLSVGGDGREVGMGTIRSLRAQLWLTEEFDIDSAIFYGAAGSPDRFILKYQRLLRDLARV